MYVLVFITFGIGGIQRPFKFFCSSLLYKTHASGGNNIFFYNIIADHSDLPKLSTEPTEIGHILENEVFYKSKHFKTFIKVEIV